MLKVGLTGGIGCGKTTVSRLFEGFGVPVIDADVIAHDLVKPGQPALAEIASTFGGNLIQPDGSLNRAVLRERVFADPRQKAKLERIMHPRIFADMTAKMNLLLTEPYCILSIPLLFETQKTAFVDRVLIVDCPIEAQIRRVEQRDGLREEDIRAIIASQVSRQYRISHADDSIDNTLAPSELAEHVKKLHNFYLSISASPGHPYL